MMKIILCIHTDNEINILLQCNNILISFSDLYVIIIIHIQLILCKQMYSNIQSKNTFILEYFMIFIHPFAHSS